MRAFVLDGYGAIADHVRLAEIADPVPGPNDVRIEIHGASLNPIDRDFARREGAGLLVGIVVWLMGRKVYAASAAAGARYEWSFTESNGDQLRDIAVLVDGGAIKPVIDRELPSISCRPRSPIPKLAGHEARCCCA
jgi:NADPH:quinone reductase-like Zn-dependent oxidoreductase